MTMVICIVIFILLSLFPIGFLLNYIQSNYYFKKQFMILENNSGFKMKQLSVFHRPRLISEIKDYQITIKPIMIGSSPKKKKFNYLDHNYTEEKTSSTNSIDVLIELEIKHKRILPYSIKIDSFKRSLPEVKDINDSLSILTGDNEFDTNFLIFGNKETILKKLNPSIRKKLLEILKVSQNFTIMNKMTSCQIDYDYDGNINREILPLIEKLMDIIEELQ